MPNTIKTIKLSEGVWQFAECDAAGNDLVDAYLVCGNKRAILIDALCISAGLYKKVRKITPLPVDVILTHGHEDHAGVSLPEFFGKSGVYIDEKDIFLCETLCASKDIERLSDGQIFELGGRTLEIISVAGHTPGSVVVLDRTNELMFTGDTIGSGNFWMQLPESLPLEIFLTNLERLHKTAEPYKNLLIYPGHRRQGSNQMTGIYLRDVLAATRRIVDGTLKGRACGMIYKGIEINMKRAGLRTMRGYYFDPLKINACSSIRRTTLQA